MQEISLESLATGLLTELTRTFSPDGLHTISSGVVEGLMKGLADPTVKEAIASTFCPTGLDVARDALSACEHGQMSHEATLKIVAIALTDDAQRKATKLKRC